MALIQFLGTPNGQKLISTMIDPADNGSLMTSVLQGLNTNRKLGIKNITPADVTQALQYAQSMQSQPLQANNLQPSDINGFKDLAKKLIKLDPKAAAILAGVDAVSTTLRAGGDVYSNGQNRLAASLLEGMREHTDDQDARYGKSLGDRATYMQAQDLMRRGDRAKIITDAASGFLDRLVGNQRNDNLAVNQVAQQLAINQLTGGIPAALFNHQARQTSGLNQVQKRNYSNP